MRVIVTGSRKWGDIHAIRMALLRLPPAATIVHGDAPGADTIAKWLAEDFGFTVEAHPADWKKHGKRGGPIRNQEMVDAGADLMLAFPLPESIGTHDCMRRAEKAGIPVKLGGGG